MEGKSTRAVLRIEVAGIMLAEVDWHPGMLWIGVLG